MPNPTLSEPDENQRLLAVAPLLLMFLESMSKGYRFTADEEDCASALVEASHEAAELLEMVRGDLRTPPEFGLRQTVNGSVVEVSSQDRVAAAKAHILLAAAPDLLKFVGRFILSSTTGLPYVEGEPSLLEEARDLVAQLELVAPTFGRLPAPEGSS